MSCMAVKVLSDFMSCILTVLHTYINDLPTYTILYIPSDRLDAVKLFLVCIVMP